MTKFAFPLLALFLCATHALAHVDTVGMSVTAVRVEEAPKIDGLLDEPVWLQALPATNFTQRDPVQGNRASQRTEVRIIYDNQHIYIGAMMFDTHPDSILTELGLRDSDDLNADQFFFSLDTYGMKQDAYFFGVTASGVQLDGRESDFSYDAVWWSSVEITEEGWSVEMRIPYSAIRFPSAEVQSWRVNFERMIRRKREIMQWIMIPETASNDMDFYGALEGVRDIDAPVRLSVTPYASYYIENNENAVGDEVSSTFGGGLDLKYGINDAFTLDLTLLPDFSQVQSDNLVKNLTPFEVVFQERRPFFQEGVELYRKSNLFYSRRIGGTPSGFYGVEGQLEPGEKLIRNPSQARLLNATKVSGRTKKGLGIGFLNAVSGNTYAEAKDEDGSVRKILTDPLTNYNITVFDQQLMNNSSLYLINTSVLRDKTARDANVTSVGLTLFDKKIKWRTEASGTLSNVITQPSEFSNELENKQGYKYYLEFGKASGKLRYNAYRFTVSDDYDANDLGTTFQDGFIDQGFNITYRTPDPWGPFNVTSNSLNLWVQEDHNTGEIARVRANYDFFVVNRSFHAAFGGVNTRLLQETDYFEARSPGRRFVRGRGPGFWVGISSDYRRPLALDGSVEWGQLETMYPNRDGESWFNWWIRPRLRVSDRFTVENEFNVRNNMTSIGWVSNVDGIIYFGGRDVTTYVNTLSGRYLFMNNMSLSLRGRHYWSSGKYDQYFWLRDDGLLGVAPWYNTNHDFSTNFFNIDVVFEWWFAPGSQINIIYKNAIASEEGIITPGYIENLNRTLDAPQINSLSIKALYFFDYQYIARSKKARQ